ncbi:DMT family transporter [Ciceribacter thiooxidans]|uniref:DMT family transporter n=1 Tax=Ciceribacter thiooxidans TaxID=1969821 RepID=A0ABV7I543_9HYPH|nr:DMT family transporter [Ciceribacter thiooxidans]MDI6837131.1 DMT family transporter [Rhizobiaceae bacterium]
MSETLATSLAVAGRRRWIAVSAMIGSAACWGFATVMSRDLLDTMSSSALLVVQLTASVAALLLLAIPNAPWRYRSSGIGQAALIGILEPGLTYTIGLVGLSLTSADSASVISASEPVLIVLVAWLLLRQRPSPALIGCIGLAVVGLLLVSGEALLERGQTSSVGDSLIVLATLFAASYVVLSSRVTGDFPAATLASAQQIVGLAFAIGVFLIVQSAGLERQTLTGLSPGVLAYAALSGVVQYALAFWLYLVGLRYLSPAAAGLWLTLVPVFGLVGAYVWLHEVPTGWMIAGAALIIGAVVTGRSQE